MSVDDQSDTNIGDALNSKEKAEDIVASTSEELVVQPNLDFLKDDKSLKLFNDEIAVWWYAILAVILLLLDIAIIFFSAKEYLCFIKNFDHSKAGTTNLSVFFSIFSVFWFALTALAVTIVSKILYSLAEEIRLQTSRKYLKNIILLGVYLPGLTVKEMFDLATRAVFVADSSKSDTKIVSLPVEKLLDTVNELIKSVKGK